MVRWSIHEKRKEKVPKQPEEEDNCNKNEARKAKKVLVEIQKNCHLPAMRPPPLHTLHSERDSSSQSIILVAFAPHPKPRFSING